MSKTIKKKLDKKLRKQKKYEILCISLFNYDFYMGSKNFFDRCFKVNR